MRKPLNLALGAISLAGLLVAIWAHAVSLLNMDPQRLFGKLWVFQFVLFLLLVPLVIQTLRRGIAADPLDLPRARWRAIWCLLIYYALHFYLFLFMAPQHLHSALTWRMFSAGWLVLFALTGFFYWAKYTRGAA